MSISTDSLIMVGLPYKDAIAKYGNSIDIPDLINCGKLECSSYRYDSPWDNNIVGLSIRAASRYAEIDFIELSVLADAAKRNLNKIFKDKNFEAKIYLTHLVS